MENLNVRLSLNGLGKSWDVQEINAPSLEEVEQKVDELNGQLPKDAACVWSAEIWTADLVSQLVLDALTEHPEAAFSETRDAIIQNHIPILEDGSYPDWTPIFF
jgi:hypothetical protein